MRRLLHADFPFQVRVSHAYMGTVLMLMEMPIAFIILLCSSYRTHYDLEYPCYITVMVFDNPLKCNGDTIIEDNFIGAINTLSNQ